MKLSTKGRYAVMAMVDIGTNGAGRAISLAEIAERQDISQEYLEQLFVKLRKAGLVQSARGPGGGYRLARSPSDIAIFDVISAVNEPNAHELVAKAMRSKAASRANAAAPMISGRRLAGR